MNKLVACALLAALLSPTIAFTDNWSYPLYDSVSINANEPITVTKNPPNTAPGDGKISIAEISSNNFISSSTLYETDADEFFKVTTHNNQYCIIDIQSDLYNSKHYLQIFSKTPGINCHFQETTPNGQVQAWTLSVTTN